MSMRPLILLMGVLVLGSGCLSTRKPVEPDKAVPVEYTISNGLKVTVTFESQQAHNTAQLGLTFYNKYKKDEKLLRIDDQEFFPEYFAMINTNIDDGLLFISDEEAYLFARRVFQVYQKEVTPTEVLLDIEKISTPEDVMIFNNKKGADRKKE